MKVATWRTSSSEPDYFKRRLKIWDVLKWWNGLSIISKNSRTSVSSRQSGFSLTVPLWLLLMIIGDNWPQPVEIISTDLRFAPTSEVAHLAEVPSTKCSFSRPCLWLLKRLFLLMTRQHFLCFVWCSPIYYKKSVIVTIFVHLQSLKLKNSKSNKFK